MRYRELPAPASLSDAVRCFWFLDGSREAAEPARVERIVPDGSPELILHVGMPFRRVLERQEHEQPAAFVVGQLSRPFLVRASVRARVAGVRFRPHGLARFLRIPLAELTDATLPVEDAWRVSATLLLESLADAVDDAASAALIERFLLERARHDGRPPDPRVAAAVELAGRGARVEAIARRCDLSARQVERLFRDRVGLPPKRLARIRRVQAALSLLRAGGSGSLAAVAHQVGCFDQAHLDREFRELVGQCPSAHAREPQGLNDAFASG